MLLDQAGDRDTSHMNVHGRMIHHPSVQRGAVERRIVGRGVEEEDRLRRWCVGDESLQVGGDRLVADLPLGGGNGAATFLRGDAARVHMPGDIVLLPVLPEKGCRRNEGVARDEERPKETVRP